MDRRVIYETRLRTLLRSRMGSTVTWTFALLLTWFVTGRWEYVVALNLPIVIFAVIWTYFYERAWLRVKWGIEKR